VFFFLSFDNHFISMTAQYIRFCSTKIFEKQSF